MAKFEVQARVVDLLGTQQIANCPTAISELFKNAYDAYSTKVSLDVRPEADSAILWDDGIGMTEDELLHRWLVVGASGKERLRSSTEPPKGMTPRAIQGEKGIGRLAISSLGDTLLVVSRSAHTPPGKDPFVALLINWNLIRNEQLLLSQIEVPTITFSSLAELETGIVDDMVTALRDVVQEGHGVWQSANANLQKKILHQLDTFTVDLSLLGLVTSHEWQENRGTLFIVGHLVDEFRQHLEPPRRDDSLEGHPNVELVQLLANFRKSFEQPEPVSLGTSQDFKADVRRLDSATGTWLSLFEENEAIGPEDLRSYDHRLDIRFDDEGRYSGNLEVYREPAALHPPEFQPKRKLTCGPFRLRLWYFQGRSDESTLSPEEYAVMDKKLPLFGGVMIYRDDLRVLPYGSPEFDWLRFEERRSKGAGRYFFSYRRMFGYVDISRKQNPKLIDKAGREGLIQNAAFRDFREVLIDFFREIALEHFKKGEPFAATKANLKEKADLLNAERKRVTEQRKKLRSEAQGKLDFIAQNGSEQLELLLEEGLEEIRALPDPGPAEIAAAVVRFEDRLAQREGRARLRVPQRLSLGRDSELKSLIHDHSVAIAGFTTSCHELRGRFKDAIHQEWPVSESSLELRRTLDNTYKQTLAKIGVAYQNWTDRIAAEEEALRSDFSRRHQEARSRVDQVLMSETSTTSVEKAKRAEVEDLQETVGLLSRTAEAVVEEMAEYGERLVSYLGSYSEDEPDKLRKYQFEELEELREQVDRNLELVQLGLSVEIIDHDLERLYRGIRGHLAKLRNMVRNAPNASKLTEELRASFQHLEQRYRLMSPLYRGSYRHKAHLDGRQILTYCRDFLGNLLRSVGVDLRATEAFKSFAIQESPAAVLPVFVNLIDNAIFWLRDSPERKVLLDRRGEILTVCDSGPGIHPTLFDDIFEPFVSTKPSGRGLGLYIARANLRRYHHEIWATDDPAFQQLCGACFCIRFHEDVVLSEQ